MMPRLLYLYPLYAEDTKCLRKPGKLGDGRAEVRTRNLFDFTAFAFSASVSSESRNKVP